jgi:hypothetical protein
MEQAQITRIQERIVRRLYISPEQDRYYPNNVLKKRSVKLQEELTAILDEMNYLNNLQPSGGRGALTEPLYTEEEQKKIDNSIQEISRLKEEILKIQHQHNIGEFGQTLNEI